MISSIVRNRPFLGMRPLGGSRKPTNSNLIHPILGGRGGHRGIYYGFDPDAYKFIEAAGLTEFYQKRAVDWLVRQLKAQGLWSSFVTAYPFVGGNATAHAYNLVNVGTSASNFFITFNGTFTHSPLGAAGNGASGSFASPGVVPSTNLTNNDLHFSFYCQTKGGAADSMIEIGCVTGGRNMDLFANFSGVSYFDANDTGNGRTSFTDTDARGMLVGSRTASNAAKMYKNRAIAATNTLTQTSTLCTTQMVLWGLTSTSNNSNRTLSWLSIGKGLTDNQAQVLSDVVEMYQRKLGRSVL